MDAQQPYPGRFNRAGVLVKGVVIVVFLFLVFASGVFFSDRILFPPANPDFEKALRKPKDAPATLTNSIDLSLRHTGDDAWIATSFISVAQYESLTGTAPIYLSYGAKDPAAAGDRPVGNVTYAAAEAFCKILTNAERASGLLPKSFHYRLPRLDEIPSSNQGPDEWLASESPPSVALHIATAELKVTSLLYAPEADATPGGWVQWHSNLLAGPAGALHLPKDSAPLIEITGFQDGIRRQLSIHASGTDPTAAAQLANSAAKVIENECRALAKKRLESEFGFLRAKVDSTGDKNLEERAALLDLMARYDITDALDLPSWFLGREALHDDLGVQNAKNNVERLTQLRKYLDDLEDDALPDLTANPGLSEAAAAYARLYAERKLLEVEELQQIKAGAVDADQNLVSTRAKIAHKDEALQIARNTLIEDVDRELKVAENLMVDLKLAQARRAKQGPPVSPTSDQPPDEAKLEAEIANLDEMVAELKTLNGDTLFDYALIHSDTESPLRSLIPEYLKHSELAKLMRKAIAQIEADSDALENSPINPNPPQEPETEKPDKPEKPAEPEPESEVDLTEEEKKAKEEAEAKVEEESEAKAAAEREAAERKVAERLKRLTEERLAKLEEFAETRIQKLEQLKSTESDMAVAEEAVTKEIATFVTSLEETRERNRKKLEYLAAKRKYLVGWHQLSTLRSTLEAKEEDLDSPPVVATIVSQATAEGAEREEEFQPVFLVRGSRSLPATPDFHSPTLHFRVVLDRVSK